MIINCPNCKSELEFPEESVGANVRCGACGIKFASLDAQYQGRWIYEHGLGAKKAKKCSKAVKLSGRFRREHLRR